MKRVSILTTTRAEFGLLKNVIKSLESYSDLDVRVVVTGTHLSKKYGNTYREIENAGITIDKKIDIMEDENISSIISRAISMFSAYFSALMPDMLVVLGDRYETFAVCVAAMVQCIPIAHLYGGETTEGALDEAFRHSITKMSYLHFTALEEYRKRVIQLGENPNRVFTVGSMGAENIVRMQLLTREELVKEMGVYFENPYIVVTFHPVTLECQSAETQVNELIAAMEHYSNYCYIITKANADTGGEIVNDMLAAYAKKHNDRILMVDSLGVLRYLSALKYAAMVVGNSSSGIMEAPIFKIPTINIGDRQRGRLKAESVINCESKENAIVKAIQKAGSDSFREKLKNFYNPYYCAQTSERIAEIIHKNVIGKIELKKSFYDINFLIGEEDG